MQIEKLKDLEGYDEFAQWFEGFFGGKDFSVGDVLNHPAVTPDILHWLYQFVGLNRQEKELYWSKLKIEGDPVGDGIVFCDNVGKHCHIVCRSSNVNTSTYVFGSGMVDKSQNVLESSYVDGSHHVYYSNFVYDSGYVTGCDNVTKSFYCANSRFVVSSKSVVESENVQNSEFIDNCRNVTSSEFCGQCEDVDHCLLCFGVKGKSYCVFNREVSPELFEMLRRQLESFVLHEANLVNRWSEYQIPLDRPALVVGAKSRYRDCMKDAFWQWVLTLPQFDSQVCFKLFYKVLVKN